MGSADNDQNGRRYHAARQGEHILVSQLSPGYATLLTIELAQRRPRARATRSCPLNTTDPLTHTDLGAAPPRLHSRPIWVALSRTYQAGNRKNP
jgi:hypothetical protein